MVQNHEGDSRFTERRAEILRRAAGVFRRRGYHGAGMREIAAGLGMAPGALYYYFRSKDDLLYACQEISLQRLNETARRIVRRRGPADERLRALITAHLDLTLDELGGSAAHVEFHALPPEKLRDIVAGRDAYERSIRTLIRQGVRTGIFRAVDVKLTAMALLGALNWTVVWWRPEGGWDSQDLVGGFVDLFLEGLCVRLTSGCEGENMGTEQGVDRPQITTARRVFRVNGEEHDITFAAHKTLLEVLREDLGLTGTKHGCELGECGVCTVLLDGEPVLSCLVLALEADERSIETVEGLAGNDGVHPLQTAFAETGATQCGYCTPGFLLTARALLEREPQPDRARLVEELSGNLCRCTGYGQIYEAIERAADAMCVGDTSSEEAPHDV